MILLSSQMHAFQHSWIHRIKTTQLQSLPVVTPILETIRGEVASKLKVELLPSEPRVGEYSANSFACEAGDGGQGQ